MKLGYRIKSFLLTLFGDIKVYRYPFWVVYCPTSFKVKGKETREALQVLKMGDLVLRGYDDYLDGKFIPGKYSHTGIYIDGGLMIHAVAEGVSRIDAIDFLRCDRFCILRPSRGTVEAAERATRMLGMPYDFNFSSQNNRTYCHELGAIVYHELGVRKQVPTWVWGLIKGPPTYLAESFLNNRNFSKVLEV